MSRPRYRGLWLALAVPLLLAGCSGAASGAGPGSPFCNSAQDLAALQRDGASTSSPEGLANFMHNATGVTAQLEKTAPEAVKADATTLSTGMAKIDGLLGTVDYDLSKLAPDQQQTLADPNLNDATRRVASYVTSECDVTLTAGNQGQNGSTGSTPAATPAPSTPDGG